MTKVYAAVMDAGRAAVGIWNGWTGAFIEEMADYGTDPNKRVQIISISSTGRIYVGVQDLGAEATLYSYESDGTPVASWLMESGCEGISSIYAVDDDSIYVVPVISVIGANDCIVKYDSAGAILDSWLPRATNDGLTSIVVANDQASAFIFGQGSTFVQLYDFSTAPTDWSTDAPGAVTRLRRRPNGRLTAASQAAFTYYIFNQDGTTNSSNAALSSPLSNIYSLQVGSLRAWGVLDDFTFTASKFVKFTIGPSGNTAIVTIDPTVAYPSYDYDTFYLTYDAMAVLGIDDEPNGFSIDDVDREILQPWEISEQLNERGTMRFGVKSMDATYRPGLREVVNFNWSGVHFFAGHIHHMDEGGLGGLGVVPIVTDCGATDFNALPERRQVAITLPAGTLKSMLILLEPYLTAFGVTLDTAQVDGPTLVELTFAIGTLTAVLDKLSVVSEYAWEIDYNKVLRMFQPGSVATPFDIVDGDARVVGDVRVAPTTVDYVNRVIVLAGSGTHDVADTFVGDGVEDTFDLNYTLVSSYGYVTVDSIVETLGPGATWEYNEVDNSITRTAGAPGNLDPIVITYVAQFPFEVIAEDVPAQDGGANLYERTYSHPEVFDVVTAQALADGYLIRGLVQPREVRYRTRLSGVRPGMQQQIQVTGRNVDGPCLITAVNTTPEGSALYNYDVTAVEGLVIVQSHQSKWRARTARSA